MSGDIRSGTLTQASEAKGYWPPYNHAEAEKPCSKEKEMNKTLSQSWNSYYLLRKYTTKPSYSEDAEKGKWCLCKKHWKSYRKGQHGQTYRQPVGVYDIQGIWKWQQREEGRGKVKGFVCEFGADLRAIMRQIVSWLGHMVSVTTAQLCKWRATAATDSTQMPTVWLSSATSTKIWSYGIVRFYETLLHFIFFPPCKNMKLFLARRLSMNWWWQ